MTNNLQKLIQTLKQLSPEEMEEVTKELEKKDGQWVPKEDEMYYFVAPSGDIHVDHWDNDGIDKDRLRMNNVFKTEEEAQRYAKRLESMKKTWLPEKGEEYCIALHDYYNTLIWGDNTPDWRNYHTGNVHRTKKDALDWWKKYGEYWRGV